MLKTLWVSGWLEINLCMIIVWWYMIMILSAHLYGYKVLGTWLLTFYEQGKIHLKQLIVLLQATVLHRFAPGTSSSPVSSPSTSGATFSPCPDAPGATDSVSSPLLGPSGKLSVHPCHHQVFLPGFSSRQPTINISSVSSPSKENKALQWQ
jgi:hypothetical protein